MFTFFPKRLISLCNSSYKKNLYEVLEVQRSAKKADIKSAYYKLSQKYHPDHNQGSKSATEKFQEVKHAYDILSNYKTRRLYDQGLLSDTQPDFEEQGPTFKDKESTVVQKQRPVRTGPTPIYDFDEWSRAHYGQSFHRRSTARADFDSRKRQAEVDANLNKNTVVGVTVVILFGLFLLMGVVFEDKDKPKPPKKF